jgi:hypothetical protein
MKYALLRLARILVGMGLVAGVLTQFRYANSGIEAIFAIALIIGGLGLPLVRSWEEFGRRLREECAPKCAPTSRTES